MNIVRPAIGLICGVTLTAAPVLAQTIPLQKINSDCSAKVESLVDAQLWKFPSGQRGDYKQMLRSIDHSLKYLGTPSAKEKYAHSKIPGFTHYRVTKSLERFRELVRVAKSPKDLAQKVHQEFDLYQSIGSDGNGKVKFTSYFEPTYSASRTQTEEYRYPLYKAPPDLKSWPQPHPTRLELEGRDGRGGSLKGHELVWLRDRLEAYLVQVQGSARLQMTDGTTKSIGFDGKTDYDYVSLGKELIKDGRFAANELSLPKLLEFFRNNPKEMDTYIPRNNRFIFFKATNGAPATGSIGVPVTAERSIATDKSLMPPGALALLQTKLPYHMPDNQIKFQPVNRFVLDQDTGSAIKGPGRVDVFLGTGEKARQRAGLVNHEGKLYYLLLKQ